VDPQFIIHGGKIVEPPVIPTGTSYGLVGWFTANGALGGSGIWGDKWDFASGKVNGDITLYANWSSATRTIHLQVNGGTRPSGQEITRVNFTVYVGYEVDGVVPGGKIIDPGPMARDGYTFGGWYTDLSYTNEWNFMTSMVKEIDDWDLIIIPNRLKNDYFTLYAKWVPNIYYVNFAANGGTPAPGRQEVAHGERVQLPPIMSKPAGDPNGAFLGWYTELAEPLNAVHLWNFDTNVVKSNMTLYAGWGPITYTVKFHLGNPNEAPPNSVFKKPADQYVINDGKVLEPFMPPLPAANITSWSFCRWDYSDTPAIDPSNFNSDDKDLRDPYLARLKPWNFNIPIKDVTPNPVTGEFVLNLYARWVEPEPDMVWVPRGSFTMGDSGVSGTPAAYHAYPTRQVTLDGFYISRFEITQTHFVGSPLVRDYTGYNEIIGVNPSQFTANSVRPVERVSWYDAINYCIELTKVMNTKNIELNLTQVYQISGIVRSAIPPAASPLISISSAVVAPPVWTNTGYRLPTEAEWEYAARGGNASPGNFTWAGSDDSTAVAWYNDTVKTRPEGDRATQTVGTKSPNALGIYDMGGNVSEWVWDWFVPYKDLITANPPDLNNNPKGSATGTERVRRGGGWSNSAANSRSVVRNSDVPSTAHWVVGFRIARNPSNMW